MTVLCYVRPWNEKQFNVICKEAFPGKTIQYISDFPGHTSTFQEQLVLALKKQAHNVKDLTMLDKATLDDVVMRCRLLRALTPLQAYRLVNACVEVVDDLFDKYQPMYVIGLTVDSYVIDVIRIVSEKRAKKYLGLIPLFIKGYCRLTSRGEYTHTRVVEQDEINEIYEKLVIAKEKPDFLRQHKSPQEIKANWTNNNIKNKLRYLYMKVQRLRSSSHYYCYHYWSSEIIAKSKKQKVNLDLFANNFQIPNDNRSSCYIPLQHIPECTVDYWVHDQDAINYYAKLLEVVECLSDLQVNIFIKEHPNCLGIRPDGFYHKLKAFKNVTLLSPLIDSDTIIPGTDFTLVWTGTAGAEAYLAGKPVVHLGNPYYINNKDEFISFSPNLVVPFRQCSEDHEKKAKLFIKHILEGAIRASFYHELEGRSKESVQQEMELLGVAVKQYIGLNI